MFEKTYLAEGVDCTLRKWGDKIMNTNILTTSSNKEVIKIQYILL